MAIMFQKKKGSCCCKIADGNSKIVVSIGLQFAKL